MTGKITIYTDGGCEGNPGIGGYGIIMEYNDGNKIISKEFYQGYEMTTNNRMELLAVIVGLEKIKKENQKVQIFSDSKYVVDPVAKQWLFNWEKKYFAKGGKPRINADLWKRFLLVYRKHQVKIEWVRGHDSNPRNERCDHLVAIARKGELLIDKGFPPI
ncbi:MAG: ribonuclease HI [Flavobacteriaceae bacterium]|nr:ribonuclease HI [Flavobacteriaceae bacterium]